MPRELRAYRPHGYRFTNLVVVEGWQLTVCAPVYARAMIIVNRDFCVAVLAHYWCHGAQSQGP